MRTTTILVILLIGLACFGEEVLGAEARADKPVPHLVFLISEDPSNYEAHKTIPAFAQMLRHEHGFRCTVIQGEGQPGAFRFPGLEVLKKADLLVIFFRRRALSAEQLGLIRGHLKAGKPLVGIRTANHAFSVRGAVGEGHQKWWEFVPEVLGCKNRGYGPLGVDVSAAPGAAKHPILAGVKLEKWHSKGSLYLVKPIDPKATVLLIGSAGDKTEPIAWTRNCKGSRIFYTSLGYPDDFKLAPFRRLLVNGIRWALGKPARPADATWKVGTAKVNITPAKPLWMAGYGSRKKPAEGTLHDLWVKIATIEDAAGHRAAIVTADHLGWPRGMYDRICAELQKRCKLDRSQVMLASSHTHTGPVLRGAVYDCYPLDGNQHAMIEQYSLGLEKDVVAAVDRALGQMTPATLRAGQGSTPFAVNRRNNPQSKISEMREQGIPIKGPSDHDVPVLAIRSPQGDLRAVVFGYACHCTTLSFYQWSGDYAGFAQLDLEKAHPGILAMFYAGCGADQNPLPRRSVELCRKYGNMLAGSVDQVLNKSMRPVAPKLQTAFEFVALDFGDQPTKEELEVASRKSGYRGRWAGRLLRKLEAGETFAKTYRYPVQVWRLGNDQLWIALGGETVVDYALKFKKRFGPNTWVAGYTNDVMSYIPSHRVWEEGGYESGAFYVYGLPANRWAEDIEDRIIAAVDRLVAKLR